MDPVNNLSVTEKLDELQSVLIRLIDFLKHRSVTAIFAQLQPVENSDLTLGVSSLMDSWLALRNEEQNGQFKRTLFVMKSRGMAHSNERREFTLSNRGVRLGRGNEAGPTNHNRTLKMEKL
jgi:circadian clock protein KaiC